MAKKRSNKERCGLLRGHPQLLRGRSEEPREDGRDERPRKSPHRSFKRSYREDYLKESNIPGIMQHFFTTLKILCENWKLFLPFLLLMVTLNALLVGAMSESSYVKFQTAMEESNIQTGAGEVGNFAKAGVLLVSTITAGGLTGGSSETTIFFGITFFLIIWLTTIFILRQRLAKHKLKLRDALYNSMTPLISTFAVFLVALVQCIPIFLLVIAYSAAVQTEFLTTPFYALLFFVFAALIILISGYFLSSSIIALIAVSVPGMYPQKALKTASALMMGQRTRFILRLVALIIALAIVWFIVMIPLIMLDLWLKTFAWASGLLFIPICLSIMACFTMIYATSYLYLYYRWTLDNEKD